MDEPTVGDVGEFAVIRRLTGDRDGLINDLDGGARRGGPGPDASGTVGPGDDSAVIAAPDGRVVACTDMLVEGRHFRLDWSAPSDVGHKAIAQNAADIAAMGAVCTGFLVSVGCPSSLAARVLDEIAAGAREEAAALGADVIGGDLVEAPGLVLSVTALGDMEGRTPVLRSGAREGDVVAIAGKLGASAAGLALLQSESQDGQDGRGTPRSAEAPHRPGADPLQRLVDAHRRPAPPYAAGVAAAVAGASAMIDTSDGLVADLGHIAAASGVVIDLDPGALSPGQLESAAGDDLREAGDAVGTDPWQWVLGGGEDHALVATYPDAGAVPRGWRVIGSVHPSGDGAAAVVVGGAAWRGAPGWVAFEG